MAVIQKAASHGALIVVRKAAMVKDDSLTKELNLFREAISLLRYDVKCTEHKVFFQGDDIYLHQVLATGDIQQQYWLCVELYRMSRAFRRDYF